MAFNQSCYGLRAKENIVDAEYLYYLIKHNVVILKKNTHGSVFDTITRGTFDGIEVELPSFQEQYKVASILRDYDNKIELNNKINKNLEEQVSVLYCQMFEVSPSKKWEYGTLSDIAIVTSGKRPPMKSTAITEEAVFPIVGAASIMGFTNAANHNDKILVIGRVGTHGIVQRFNSPCWTSDNTLVIKSDYYEYLYQILKRIDYSSLNRGSTQPLITQGDINKIPILIPDKGTLSKYEEVAGTIMSKYETNMRENQLLAQIRDTLLPSLMSGELDVSGIDL